MKYHTQGQRFSGTGSARAVVRRTALAVAVVASGVGTYVLVVAPVSSTAAVQPTTRLNLASQSIVAASTTPRAISAIHGNGGFSARFATMTTPHPTSTSTSTIAPSPSTTVRSTTTTTAVPVTTPAVKSHAVALKPTTVTKGMQVHC